MQYIEMLLFMIYFYLVLLKNLKKRFKDVYVSKKYWKKKIHNHGAAHSGGDHSHTSQFIITVNEDG